MDLNITELKVHKGLVVNVNILIPQLIRVTASTSNISDGIHLTWYNASKDGTVETEPFAAAMILAGTAADYLSSLESMSHLIERHIDALNHMAHQGIASRFSRGMAYSLFASKFVDYADEYRGMQSVLLHAFEAFADITLATEKAEVWTVPPHFIDSVAHLSGFIMNFSDTQDTFNNF